MPLFGLDATQQHVQKGVLESCWGHFHSVHRAADLSPHAEMWLVASLLCTHALHMIDEPPISYAG